MAARDRVTDFAQHAKSAKVKNAISLINDEQAVMLTAGRRFSAGDIHCMFFVGKIARYREASDQPGDPGL
jgi:hypothetical protein